MRFRTLTISALAGLTALSLSCSDGAETPTAPTAQEPAGLPAGGQSLSLFGLDGAGLGVPGLACGAPQYRQFDFWVGTWEVTTLAPRKSANIVTKEVGSCAVFENWHAANGGRGRSMSVYDASDGQWHQQWVENSGFFPLRLDGGITQGAMIMQGSYPDPFGTPTVFTDRYTWTGLGPDDVRQLVEQSTDGGVTFPRATFDGHYHRNANATIPVASSYPYCTDPSLSLFREFDFTLGRWSVTLEGPGATGAEAPHRRPVVSQISRDLDGCLYEEKLTGVAGYEARAFTNIRPLDEIWQRTYVDSRGLRIYLTGPRIQDGKIVLSGKMPGVGRRTQDVRVMFEQVDASHFVERWERANGSGWDGLVTATYSRQ